MIVNGGEITNNSPGTRSGNWNALTTSSQPRYTYITFMFVLNAFTISTRKHIRGNVYRTYQICMHILYI